MNKKSCRYLFQRLLTPCLIYYSTIQLTHSQSNVLRIPPGKYADEAQKAFQAMNVPIKFYGTVADQDGKPLADVKVVLSVQKPYFDPVYLVKDHNPRFERITGADGGFTLDNVAGKNVEIESMTKQGYEAEPNVKHVYGPVGGSVDTPMNFTMWRQDITEPIIMRHRAFHVVPDGSPYVIDLTRGTIAHSNDPLGDLRICIRMGSVSSNRDFDWSLEVRVINGGLVEERELASPMYRAPADHYTNVFFISHRIGEKFGRAEGTFRFFLELKQGTEFGRCAIDIGDYLRLPEPAPLHIDYAINPSGSRILR